MQRHGWTLLFHEGVTTQLRKLQEAATRAEQNDPQRLEQGQPRRSVKGWAQAKARALAGV
jgi:hypothetical protein